ncbi:hypothetical protein [Halorubellus sp. PRR65]|uniref:hypothetical protein n=1 Tax=Halorubellus sp. PRR65 TaxID=3098148 RepID=UPI002B25E0C5|nr:hypothetical protein [Halorubellus sp. PRR65]
MLFALATAVAFAVVVGAVAVRQRRRPTAVESLPGVVGAASAAALAGYALGDGLGSDDTLLGYGVLALAVVAVLVAHAATLPPRQVDA